MKTLILLILSASAIFAQGSMVQGGTPTGAPGTDQPVMIGGIDSTGTKQVIGASNGVIATVFASAGSDAVLNSLTGGLSTWSGAVIPIRVTPLNWNGASWDRQFTCASSAVVSVTTSTTSQIVALSSAKVVRVCALVLTSAAATTATLSYGTGTNCGTGNVALSGAMALGASAPLSVNLGNESAIRTAASNEFCVAAGAGASPVAGFISYAQY